MTRVKYRIFLSLAVCLLLFASLSYAEETPLTALADTTLSYFRPLEGAITSASGNEAEMNIGSESGVRPGMRLTILRKGAQFLHPITKEPIGQVENPVGTADVFDAEAKSSRLSVIQGEANVGDVVRLTSSRVRLLFYETQDVDWSLSGEYYRLLTESERFELISTALKLNDTADLIREAKGRGADVLLVISQKKEGDKTILMQRLFRAADGRKFSEDEAAMDAAFMKTIQTGEKFFGPVASEAYLTVNIPFGVKLIGIGDVNGDGKQEMALSSGSEIGFYSISSSLEPALEGVKIKTIKGAEPLWLDLFDLNNDKKDEIILTIKGDGDITSYVYALDGNGFSPLWKENFFVRLIGGALYGQKPQRGGGYTGGVFPIVWGGGVGPGGAGEESKKLEELKLPPGVNIYDFAFINSPDGRIFILAYDEGGYLNLYDENGVRLWRSPEDYGGIATRFKMEETGVIVDRGYWSVKDRILIKDREALVIKREPFLEKAKGMGYKASEIRALSLNGLSMSDSAFVAGIGGSASAMQVSGGKLFVLASPLFGIEPGKILKGENPIINKLYIYPLNLR
jgi:hypothetical protein